MNFGEITQKQKKIVWSIWKKGVGLSDEDLYAIIKERHGKDHMSDLSYEEGESLIHFLRQKIGSSINGATAEQLYAIRQYIEGWHWSEKGIKGFLKRITRKRTDMLLELTAKEARNVLAALARIENFNAQKKKEGHPYVGKRY